MARLPRPLPAPAVFTGVRLRDVLLAAGLAEEDPEVQHIQASFLFDFLAGVRCRPRPAEAFKGSGLHPRWQGARTLRSALFNGASFLNPA